MFQRVAISILLVLLAALVAQPYVEDWMFAAREPRTIIPRSDLGGAEQSVVALFELASPSVVQVVSIGAGDELGAASGQPSQVSTGTGFVWDAAGHVVTNNHVVEGGTRIAVRLASGQVVNAELVGLAPNYDLAVLQLDREAHLPQPLAIGSSANLRVGQSSFAIGNPFGLDQTLTTGVISALNRQLPTSNGREITEVVQTDAAINPGNSGGPLLDSAGLVIGVNTAIYSPSGASAGIGFAIPIDAVNRVVPELIRSGHMPTPGIGIAVAGEEIATQLGVRGVVIAGVVPGSPAAKAGLRGINPQAGAVGDIITAANREPVHRLSDLTRILESVGVGNSVTLTLQRGENSASVELQVIDIGQAVP